MVNCNYCMFYPVQYGRLLLSWGNVYVRPLNNGCLAVDNNETCETDQISILQPERKFSTNTAGIGVAAGQKVVPFTPEVKSSILFLKIICITTSQRVCVTLHLVVGAVERQPLKSPPQLASCLFRCRFAGSRDGHVR